MDLISTISEQLKAHTPFDLTEEQSISRTLQLISDIGKRSLDRDSFTHHITGSAFILWQDKILLHFHKKFKMWIQPGGHLDSDETPLEAAARELLEETDVRVDFARDLFHIDVHDAGTHMHYDMRFLGVARDRFVRPQEGESKSVAWFNLDLLSLISDSANKGAYEKIRSISR